MDGSAYRRLARGLLCDLDGTDYADDPQAYENDIERVRQVLLSVHRLGAAHNKSEANSTVISKGSDARELHAEVVAVDLDARTATFRYETEDDVRRIARGMAPVWTAEEVADVKKRGADLHAEFGGPRTGEGPAQSTDDIARAEAWLKREGLGNTSWSGAVSLASALATLLANVRAETLQARLRRESPKPPKGDRAPAQGTPVCDVCKGSGHVLHNGDDYECQECAGTGTTDPAWLAVTKRNKEEAARKASAARGSTLHRLKTHTPYFHAIVDGSKTFEVRKNDRDFWVGDVLRLEEWNPGTGYTDAYTHYKVTYLAQGIFGLPADVCVMSIAPAFHLDIEATDSVSKAAK